MKRSSEYLTEEQKQKIKKLVELKMPYSVIALRFGICKSTVKKYVK